MDTKEVLHMTKGDGEFSYASNTINHNRFSGIIKPVLERALKSLMVAGNMRPSTILNVADLGCGVGPCPIALISATIEIVHDICKKLKWDDCQVPEVQLFMSDLPSNDFNLLFKDVEKLQEEKENGNKSLCFVMATPGSFHGRLFPRNSLHLVHSSYAIHWLSQVPRGLSDEQGKPMNKGKIVASETSHSQVLKAYRAQFQQDFTKFLICRSHEVASNGHMVLTTFSRPSIEPFESLSMKFVFQALTRVASKGVVKEEQLDSFNMPSYVPCKEEIVETVSQEGSFAIEHIDVISDVQHEVKDAYSGAERLAKITRSYTEASISNHFGAEIWNELYDALYQVILDQSKPGVDPLASFQIIILLRKKKRIDV